MSQNRMAHAYRIKKALLAAFALLLCCILFTGCRIPFLRNFVGQDDKPYERPPLPDTLDLSHPSLSGELQTMGTAELGYVDLPASWSRKMRWNTGSLTMESADTLASVTLEMMPGYKNDEETWAEVTADVLRELEATVTTQKTTFGPYSATLVSATGLNGTHTSRTWIFAAEDGHLHYVAVEAPADYFDNLSTLVEFTYLFLYDTGDDDSAPADDSTSDTNRFGG